MFCNSSGYLSDPNQSLWGRPPPHRPGGLGSGQYIPPTLPTWVPGGPPTTLASPGSLCSLPSPPAADIRWCNCIVSKKKKKKKKIFKESCDKSLWTSSSGADQGPHLLTNHLPVALWLSAPCQDWPAILFRLLLEYIHQRIFASAR